MSHDEKDDKNISWFFDQNSGSEIANQNQANEKASYHRELRSNQLKRTATVTNILNNYTTQQTARYDYKTKKKPVIFWFLLSLIGVLTLAVVAWVVLAIILHEMDAPNVATIIASLVTYLGALISVLLIIVNYIFPADEETNFNNLVSTIIENDADVMKTENEFELKNGETGKN